MQIQIGAAIARLRREANVTQEQLAAAVGVSAPAVSKWETGQSYPDITLLPALARYFGVTVDTLLAYVPELDDEGREALYDAAREVFGTGGWTAGLAHCEALLVEYPTDMMLRILLSGLLVQSLVFAENDAQRAEGRARQVRWLEEAIASTDGKTQLLAKNLLAGFYMQVRRLEEAEALYTEMLDIPVNAPQMMPTLRMLQNRNDDAMQLAQQNLLTALNDACSALLTMTSLAIRLEQPDVALRCAQAVNRLLPLFQLEDTVLSHMAGQSLMMVASASKDDALLLEGLEKYMGAVARPVGFSESPYFDRLHKPAEGNEPSPQTRALRAMLADEMQGNDGYAGIRDNPRFQALLAQLQAEGEG